MTQKKIIGIIPARFASTRFPGKPLTMIGNMSMIERVYKQALKSKKLDHVVVATDDDRIRDHVQSFNGNVVMTATDHKSGTDRCAEVIKKEKEKWDIVINIQGDEPFIDPDQIDVLISCFDDELTEIATLIKRINNEDDLANPNVVKVVINKFADALYFSRSKIPYQQNANAGFQNIYFKHIGIYGYFSSTLEEISLLKQTRLEQAESLEQLRWIENGYLIKTAVCEHESISIDTPEDLEKVKHLL
ncbi:MAG: 3-deoxy-manno-octulosonate cytidylyltransferase [Bacteroidia bacterium]